MQVIQTHRTGSIRNIPGRRDDFHQIGPLRATQPGDPLQLVEGGSSLEIVERNDQPAPVLAGKRTNVFQMLVGRFDLYIDITRPSADRRRELLAGERLGRVRNPAGGNQVRPNLHEPLDLFDRKTAKVRPEFGHLTRFEDRPAIPETLFLYANADHGRPPPTVLMESHDPPPPPPHEAG